MCVLTPYRATNESYKVSHTLLPVCSVYTGIEGQEADPIDSVAVAYS